MDAQSPVQFCNGGLFISRGRGRHITRVIDNYELIFVRSGVLSIQEDGRSFEVSKGQYIILYPGRIHGGTRDYPANLSFFWGHFLCDPSFLAALPQYGTVARANWMSEYYSLLLNAQREANNQQACNLLLQLLLNEAVQSPLAADAQSSAKYFAEEARRIIILNYADELSTASIAAQLRCNPDYLGRLYHDAFGLTITDEINKVRCSYAAELLRNSTASLKEIAWHCGYNDEAYFRRRFQRIYAMSPAQYRALHGREHINSF